MPLVAGRILLEDEVVEGWLDVRDGKVADSGEGAPPEKPDAKGWVVPAPVNAHTHVADTFLRDVAKPMDLASLVGPKGWKHEQLARAKPADIEGGIRKVADEMAAIGTASFIDFREGGAAGARMLADLGNDLPVAPFILGRPAKPGFDAEEAAEVLAVADGVGVSALRDVERHADIEAWAQATHRVRKVFALHLSEGVREDVEAAIALQPRFVVHAVQATKADLGQLADERISVVICPRSNQSLGLRTPVARMREAGVTMAVGTDNGMLADGNLLAELTVARSLDSKVGDEELLRWATWNGRALVGLPGLRMRKGSPADLVVLPDQFLGAAAERRPGFVVPT